MTDCTCPDTWTRRIGQHVPGCRAAPGCTCPAAAYLTGTRDVDCPAHGTAPRWRSLEVDAIADADQLERDLADDPYLAGGLVGDGGPGLAAVHPGEVYATREQIEAPRQQGRGYAVTDLRPLSPVTKQQIARAFDVPLVDVDPARLRAEVELRGAELDRWCAEGGPDVDLERPLPPLVVEIRADATVFSKALIDAARQLLDPFRRLAAAFIETGRQLGRAFGIAGPWTDPAARRWAGDLPPRRWRDWLPATERKVDRARREQLERQLRTLDRRAARRRRKRARAAAPWYAIQRAGLRGADALDVLRAAAGGAA